LRVIFYVKREDWYPKKKTFGDKIKHTFDTAEEEGKKKDKEKKRWVMEVCARSSF
jgi:hypothetical protein